jgi:hypothetical protein
MTDRYPPFAGLFPDDVDALLTCIDAACTGAVCVAVVTWRFAANVVSCLYFVLSDQAVPEMGA